MAEKRELDSKRMKLAVQRVNYQAKHGWGVPLPKNLSPWKSSGPNSDIMKAGEDSAQQYHYDEMAKANAFIRKGNYDDAYTVLSEEIFEIENDFKQRQITPKEKNQFYGDVIRRLERMTRGRADEETRQYAAELIDMAKEKQIGYGLEGKTLGFVSIGTAIIGLALFLPNITGNAVNNSSSGSGLMWLWLLLMGIIGFLIYLFDRK